MNIEDDLGLAKRTINYIVIAITSYCLFKNRQSLLFIYKDICFSITTFYIILYHGNHTL